MWSVFLVCGGVLSGQSIKINRVNLEAFPIIRLTVSIETASGQALPVDTRKLEVIEGGLPVSAFQVQPLDSLDLPVYTVIAIDKSGSMKGEPLRKAKKAAVDYIGMMEGNDHCGYIEFDTRVTEVSSFSNDRERLANSVNATVAGSDTAFLDAVFQGIQMFGEAPEGAARIVLALTDGMDNRSSRRMKSLLKAADEAGVFIYTIGLGRRVDERMLSQLSRSTNGNYYFSVDAGTLPGIYTTISTLLHSQLLVQYETLFPMDEKWHSIQIRVPREGKILMTERSYLSAKESRVPSEMLKRIRTRQRKDVQEAYYRELVQRQKRERLIIIVLAGILCVLVVMLAIALWRRRGKLTSKR